MLRRVAHSDIQRMLPLVVMHIRLAAQYAYHDEAYDYMTDGLKSGDFELWVHHTEDGIPAIAITGIYKSGELSIFEIVAVASIDPAYDWREDFQLMSRYARGLGATRVQINGRPGWTKHLKPYGFKVRKVEMHLEFDDGQ